MGTYLEDYLESMYMLPSEIKRNFDLMRELDKTSYPLIEELRATHREFLRSAREKVVARCADTEKDEPTEQELRALVEADAHLEALGETHTRVVQKLDEKIAIAAQSYDIVDHHIRRLDADLEAYAALLRANGEFEEDKSQRKRHKASHAAQQQQQQQQQQLQGLGQPPQAPTAAAASATSAQYTPQARSKASGASAKGASASAAAASSSSSASAAGGASGAGGRDCTASLSSSVQSLSAVGKAGTSSGTSSSASGGRKRLAAEAALDVATLAAPAMAVEDMPIDPNEPIYCSCRRVSFGQMVGCDNDDCKYEWFHFGCVGLTDQPQGKWYCPDCRAALGIK